MSISEYIQKEANYKDGKCTLNCSFLGYLFGSSPENTRFCNLFLDIVCDLNRVKKCKKLLGDSNKK